MARIVWHAFRTRQAYLDSRKFVSYVRSSLESEVVPRVVKEHRHMIWYWKVEPDFVHQTVISQEGVGVDVYPSGSAARLWNWVSRGVRGHMIYPRRAKALRFRPQGVGRPRGPVQPARATSGVAFSRGHWWPGIRPRKFEERIVAKLTNWYQRVSENILRRAIRRARRGR